MFKDCFLYYSAFFDDVFVPCTPSVAAERQSYVAAMTVNYIKNLMGRKGNLVDFDSSNISETKETTPIKIGAHA